MKEGVNLKMLFNDVDRLWEVSQALRVAQEEAEELKRRVAAACLTLGVKKIRADSAEATVFQSSRAVCDYRAATTEIGKKFGLSEAEIEDVLERHTQVAEGYPSVRVRALSRD